MAFTFKEVAEILKIIDASQCEEVVVELQGLRLVVRRGSPNSSWRGPGPGAPSHGTRSVAADASLQNVRTVGGNSVLGGTEAKVAVAAGHVAVRAPMVGTFYRRPSPDAAPFVEVNQHVKSGDPLCLIEVMKLYTTISAPADGVIVSITAEEASAVEFDQLLFVVKPDA